MAEKTDLENSKDSLRAHAEEILHNKQSQLYNRIDTISREEIKQMFEELEVHKIELEMQNEELRITQAELDASKQKYFDLYNLAPTGYVTVNHVGLIIEVNLTAATMFGVTKSSLIKNHLSGFMSKENQDKYYLFRKKVLKSGDRQSCDMLVFKQDGRSFWAHLIGKLTNETSVNIVISDITDLKQMEDELLLKNEMIIAQSRQAAMGDMISMIAHQWRQPLAVISMAINNISISMELDDKIFSNELIKCSGTVTQRVQYLSDTINFISFFKPAHDAQEATINDILDTTLNIISKSLQNDNIALTIESNPTSSLLITKSSLIQVLLGILSNAKEALLSNKIAEAAINISASENQDILTIAIYDNAGGIQESVLKKIGEPYFTTKEELNGKGLGLYIAKTIVEKHLFGTLSWHNNAKGACFVITLKTHSKT